MLKLSARVQGPAAGGKTFELIKIGRFLFEQGFTVKTLPDKDRLSATKPAYRIPEDNPGLPAASMPRPLYCTCRGASPGPVAACQVHGTAFEIDITTANNLIAEWGLIAADIARQCKWRPQGQCLITCQGLAVCNLDGLEFVNAQGHPAGRASPPAAKTGY